MHYKWCIQYNAVVYQVADKRDLSAGPHHGAQKVIYEDHKVILEQLLCLLAHRVFVKLKLGQGDGERRRL